MRSITKILLAAVLLTGSGYIYAKPHTIIKADSTILAERHVAGFNEIKIAGPFDVHITQGAVESVKVNAPAEIMDRIVTEVSGHVLEIHNKHDNWGWGEKSWWSEKGYWRLHPGKITVTVTVRELNSVTTSGRSSAVFENGITSQSLKLRVSGSGEVRGKVDVKTLDTHISGSGSIQLAGTAGHSTVRVTGSGSFKALSLTTSASAVHISGSGGAEINASDKVDASVSGSGGVSYTGTVKSVNSKKSGSGSIRRI
jgi:hypothetical protein